MHEIVIIILVCSVPIFVLVFIGRLYAANRARKRYENKEIEWKKYEIFLKQNKRFVVTGVTLALIGGTGLITETRSFLGITNPLFVE